MSKREEVRALGRAYHDALTIDETHRTMTLTGHWWYQGTHTVRAHPRGCEVIYQVRNVARGTRTLAFLHKPHYRTEMRRDLEQVLRKVCGDLGCGFRVT
jgi:hypothetical protein